MKKINQKELEKFDNSIEKAMGVLAKNVKKITDGTDLTMATFTIIRDKTDDNDPESSFYKKWYLSARLAVKNNGDDEYETVLDRTFSFSLED